MLRQLLQALPRRRSERKRRFHDLHMQGRSPHEDDRSRRTRGTPILHFRGKLGNRAYSLPPQNCYNTFA